MVVLSLSNLLYPTTTANTAPNPIEIISITESSSTSVEILFTSSVPKKSLSYYVINAAIELPVAAPQNSKTQNVAAIAPKNINKVIKTKATGLITAQIKNLNPKAAYNFSISAKINKGKMISSAAVEYSPLSNLMDVLSNLPSDWGNPKPIQLPTPTPTIAPVALPAFTLSSTTEARTVNTAATGFTITNLSAPATAFSITPTPPGMTFNTTTGTLTGTPSTAASATAYTVTATNFPLSASTIFTLTVLGAGTAPAAPTHNSVTGGNKQLTIAFTPGDDGGAAITDYEYSINGGDYTSAGTTTSPFTITGLSGRTAYSVMIKARNSIGLSTASSSLSATTTDSSLDANEAAAAEAARVAAANTAADAAKKQKELTELLSVIPSIAGLSLNIGDLANSLLLQQKCVKGTKTKYVKKGAKCPKGYTKKK